MVRRLRFFLYSQSLTGTGHFVKTDEIARALAPDHEVHVVDGGRPFPRPRTTRACAALSIPRIYRRAGSLAPVDGPEDIGTVMARRKDLLLDAVARLRPDVILVDQFPFFKWDLRDEILPLIERARAAHRRVKVVCSTWELPRGFGLDPRAPARELVLETFRTHFDGLLVHADPRLLALAEHLPWASEIPVPVAYSGYVSEKLEGRCAPRELVTSRGQGPVVVSTGGASLPALLDQSVRAWQRLADREATGGRTMVLFRPPFAPDDRLDWCSSLSRGGRVRLEPFSADFLPWMAAADVSISQAGYNTCANVLETRVRAILVPNPATLDQVVRARRLAERGLARILEPGDLNPDRLAQAILEALECPRPAHDVDLDGAETTRRLLEVIAEDGRWSASRSSGAHP